MVNNEVYMGAGLSASMAPEVDFDLGALMNITGKNKTLVCCVEGSTSTTTATNKSSVYLGANTDVKLIPDIYKGCLATVTVRESDGTEKSGETAQTIRIKGNTSDEIKFNQSLTNVVDERVILIIHGYGAPLPAPSPDANTLKLSSDVWLGLVSTLTPPTVDAELKQLNLAMGGTRNFSYQYKGVETLGEASFDVALNNGSWLYYALGDMTIAASTVDGIGLNDTISGTQDGKFYVHKTDDTANTTFHRIMLEDTPVTDAVATAYAIGATSLVLDDTANFGATGAGTINGDYFVWTANDTGTDTLTVADLGKVYAVDAVVKKTVYSPFPPIDRDATASNYEVLQETSGELNDILYTIKENDSGDLPSFALEVFAEKNNITPWKTDAAGENMFSRIYTGCQVNTLTLNFEEGQELTASISAMARKAHDNGANYVPRRGTSSMENMVNFEKTSADDISPFMFSDGSIKIYGQQMARVKGGSLTISNNLTAQKFIGNYDRTITSAHIPGQRMYDLNLTMLITDKSMWEELRNQYETSGTHNSQGSSAIGGRFGQIELEFTKSIGEFIKFKFDNYLTTSVDIPFPDDKGMLEVGITVSARTLPASGCQYSGNWIIWG